MRSKNLVFLALIFPLANVTFAQSLNRVSLYKTFCGIQQRKTME